MLMQTVIQRGPEDPTEELEEAALLAREVGTSVPRLVGERCLVYEALLFDALHDFAAVSEVHRRRMDCCLHSRLLQG
jgi:hypothetical protein